MSDDLLLLWYLSCRAVCVCCAPVCLCWCCLLGFCPLTKAEEWKCPNVHSLWWKLGMPLRVFMSIVLINVFTQHFVTSVAINLCLKQTCGISHLVLLKAVSVWVFPRLRSFSFLPSGESCLLKLSLSRQSHMMLSVSTIQHRIWFSSAKGSPWLKILFLPLPS